jgi:hypothetical protein
VIKDVTVTHTTVKQSTGKVDEYRQGDFFLSPYLFNVQTKNKIKWQPNLTE